MRMTSVVQRRVRTYLILQGIEAFEDEFKHSVKVVRARRSYKDIRVALKKKKKKVTITGDEREE